VTEGVERAPTPPLVPPPGAGGRAVLCDLGVALHPGDDLDDDRGPLKPSGGHSRRHIVRGGKGRGWRAPRRTSHPHPAPSFSLQIGTMEYMPPEVLRGGRAGPPGDVYAVGILIAFLLTGTPPFSDCAKPAPDCHTVLDYGYGRQELAAAVAGDGLRPRVGRVDARARALVDRAWAGAASDRPTAAQLAVAAAALADELGRDGGVVGHGRAAAVGWAAAAAPPPLDPLPTAWPGAPAWNPPPPSHVVVTAASFATAGRRDAQEDAALVAAPLAGALDGAPDGAHLLAVLDGHRGAGCAMYAVEHLPGALAAAVAAGAASPGEAVAAALVTVDARWRALEAAATAAAIAAGRTPTPVCGAAAVVAFVWGTTLAVGHVGDCRAVLGRASAPAARALTADHTAAHPGERARVLEAGGAFVLAPDGSARVAGPGLAVTRALGDADARAAGVASDPDILVHTLTPDDAFLVLASDGVWDALGDEDVCRIVRDTVKHPAMAAKRVVTEAVDRGSGDNAAAVVAYLTPVATLERVFVSGRVGDGGGGGSDGG